ncbi:hypothetical protein E1193_28235 [Micromonospora sp. KC606]|uniref:hypothetical protein n=1 Tax=Micromonospora sp. KC606 TaxID=2530379 RepID=UPI001046D779|nr:hypothetical protein [Micromonospora sp. KC606]TDC72211.1 hypothetical protein E1193_28235 [Micromonospora sp. KC606]
MNAVVERVKALLGPVRRVSPTTLLVRFGIFVVVLAGLLLAYPVQVFQPRTLLALAVVAALPAAGPRRVWPTFAALVTVGGWVIASAGYDRPIALWRLLAVAATLYLGHTLCAFAAVLPYDALVDPDVVVRWLTRAAVVMLATWVVGVVLAWLGGIGDGAGFQTATVAGLLVAVGCSGLLGWLLHRR